MFAGILSETKIYANIDVFAESYTNARMVVVVAGYSFSYPYLWCPWLAPGFVSMTCDITFAGNCFSAKFLLISIVWCITKENLNNWYFLRRIHASDFGVINKWYCVIYEHCWTNVCRSLWAGTFVNTHLKKLQCCGFWCGSMHPFLLSSTSSWLIPTLILLFVLTFFNIAAFFPRQNVRGPLIMSEGTTANNTKNHSCNMISWKSTANSDDILSLDPEIVFAAENARNGNASTNYQNVGGRSLLAPKVYEFKVKFCTMCYRNYYIIMQWTEHKIQYLVLSFKYWNIISCIRR